jgi:AcrR family transcriptional regulator
MPAAVPRPETLKAAPESAARPSARQPRGARPREFAKSAITRRRIMEAAVACLVDVGYAGMSTNLVAERAKLARSAMQYHFPTRPELVEAVVTFVHDERSAMYRAAMLERPPGVSQFDYAIDVYWEQVHHPLFVAYTEIHFAARTDSQLAAILKPIFEVYERRRLDIHREIFPEVNATADPEAVSLARDVARFLVEGMALSRLTYDEQTRVEAVLRFAKSIRRLTLQP